MKRSRFLALLAGVAFVMGLNCILLFKEIEGNYLAAAAWWVLGIILVCLSLYQPKTKGDSFV